MSDLAAVKATLQTVLDRIQGTASVDGSVSVEAFLDTLGATILPRTVSFIGDDGSRLSVIVRNRRILKVREVHPETLWSGEVASHEAEMTADGEDAGRALARAVIAVATDESARVETQLVDGDLPGGVLAGWPVARLRAAMDDVRHDTGRETVRRFRADWSDHASAWQGAETGVAVPDDTAVDADWLNARLDEWADACDAEDSGDEILHRRIVVTGGAALALVALGPERCVVHCADAAAIPRLDAALAALSLPAGED